MQISKKINLGILIYLFVILIFSWTSIIAYGHGLGDIIYAGGLIGIVMVHAITTWITTKTNSTLVKQILFWILTVIFLIIAILYTYKFTIGRGGEYSWNGNPFYGRIISN